jgi:hypothetical protein
MSSHMGLYVTMLCFHCPCVLGLKSMLVGSVVLLLFVFIIVMVILARQVAISYVIKALFSFSYSIESMLSSLQLLTSL